MQHIDFPPLGRRISRIGLGCGRIDGRTRVAQSTKLIEMAIDLGIRYFDVAPSYGMGTAEDALGSVIGSSNDFVIATKVGIPRPAYPAQANAIKRIVKPILDRSTNLKAFARKLYVKSKATSNVERPRFDFSASAICASLEESLKRLRRDRVDVLLAHEPHIDDLRNPEIEAHFREMIDAGLARAIGAGVDRQSPAPANFGSIWQSGWPGEGRAGGDGGDTFVPFSNMACIFHGVVRFAPRNWAGVTVQSPNALLKAALAARGDAIFLVSASTPQRLRELLRDI